MTRTVKFNYKCPHCGTDYIMNVGWINQEAVCTTCERNFMVEISKYESSMISRITTDYGEMAEDIEDFRKMIFGVYTNGQSFEKTHKALHRAIKDGKADYALISIVENIQNDLRARLYSVARLVGAEKFRNQKYESLITPWTDLLAVKEV